MLYFLFNPITASNWTELCGSILASRWPQWHQGQQCSFLPFPSLLIPFPSLFLVFIRLNCHYIGDLFDPIFAAFTSRQLNVSVVSNLCVWLSKWLVFLCRLQFMWFQCLCFNFDVFGCLCGWFAYDWLSMWRVVYVTCCLCGWLSIFLVVCVANCLCVWLSICVLVVVGGCQSMWLVVSLCGWLLDYVVGC